MPRRIFAMVAVLALGACVPAHMIPPAQRAAQPTDPAFYASRADGGLTLAPVDVERFNPGLLRQRVGYATDQPPGTILIDTENFHLYLVEGEGWAMRYGVAIGRDGFGWTGTGQIARRATWPKWTPPPEMIDRDPALARYEDGMPGGPNNPLGARALYVYQDGRDTLIRVHGTNAPFSIGHKASSGCFRMLNQDVVDLFNRVPPGARIIVF